MEHHEGTFTAPSKAEIYYQYWLPEGKPRAGLMISHGLAEHSGRYGNVVDYFLPKGYALYTLDYEGHGKSTGQRVYVNRFSDYVATAKAYFDLIRGWQPNLPIVLLGHSMGGIISLPYLVAYQDELAGAILSGTGLNVGESVAPWLAKLIQLLSEIVPRMGATPIEAQGVSKDPAVVDAYVNDPLVYRGKITTRTAAEMLKTVQRMRIEAHKISLPVLLVQGSEDILIDPESTKALYDLLGSEDKTLKIYEGLYHEVFNEPEREMVLSDVAAWLDRLLER
jgi:alpha-beta hydrolase superfamily lysophospholipase